MRYPNWLLVGALCAGTLLLPALAAAQSTPMSGQSSMGSQSSTMMTKAQVTSALQAAGYTDVRNVKHEGDHFDADATKNGKTMHLHVDARTGAITTANNESEEDEEHEH